MLKDKVEVKKNLMAIRGYVTEEKRNFEEYLNERDELMISDNLLSVLPANDDVTRFVKVIQVENAAGKYPYLKLNGSVLTETAELEANPVVSEVSIVNIDYGVKTFRGEIPISGEVVEDAKAGGVDISEVLAGQSKQIDLNTKKVEIVGLFKTATPEAVTGSTGLTTLVNSYSSVYNVMLFVSSSLYDVLDNEGSIDYTLEQPRFKGKSVIKLDDDLIGTTAGDLVAFVGDPYNYIHLFDRSSIAVKYINNRSLGRPLGISTRFDVQIADNEAGSYVTFTKAV